MFEPAPTAAAMPRSGIREVMDLARKTPGCIHLEVGEPSFATPAHIVEAIAEAVRDGWTKYVPNAGIDELRSALAEKIAAHNGFTVSPDQVIVTSGGAGALFTAMLTTGEPGDGVLIPDPGWPNYAMTARLHGLRAQPYRLRPEDEFLPTVETLAAADEGTRVLMLNSPSNPLGTIIPADRMREILRFAADRDLWVISDECYDAITFDDTWTSAAANGHQERVITVGTFSKTYAMTGMRVGYAAVPPALSPVLAKLQEPIVACVNAAAQRGALAALRGPQDAVEQMRDAYRERRDALAALLDHLGVRYVRPSGAFYMWVEIAGRAPDAHTFAMELLRRRAVAVAPGTAFGASGEGWVRLSLASELEALLEGARRLAEFSLSEGVRS